ncbi:gliding motility-associated C-terminal domain-containing protein [Mucilaginibacter ximonensis]|uniref:Gliding motility-associated C-terminal domain-containing protein n=1 Tax=Mucilaginibacter ximonensis TaxID=538021 RepID=A0ABW5Y7J2_9SPHI
MPLPGGGCAYQWKVIDNQQIGLPASGTSDIQPFIAVNKGTKPVTAHISVMPVSDGLAYITSSSASSNIVSVINTATRAIVATIPVDKKPFGVAVGPDGRRIYVVDSKTLPGGAPSTGVVSVIDAISNTVVDTYAAGGNPTNIVLNSSGTRAYVVNEGTGSISVLDITPNKTTIPDITNISGAVGIAISADGSRLYVGSSTQQLYVIDATTNQIIKKIQTQSAYPTSLCVSPDGNYVYVTNNTSNYISVINVTTGDSKNITVGLAPYAMAITPVGDKLYVTNRSASNTVTIINTATGSVIKQIDIPSLPQGICVSPNGRQVFVVGQDPDELEVIDVNTDQLGAPIPTGHSGAISMGDFVSAGIGCSAVPVVYSITVNPSPTIDDPGSVSIPPIHYGTSISSSVIEVSGTNLKGPLTVTAPDGFEVSTDDISFKNAVSVGAAGDIAATEVYIRLKATAPVNTYHGYVVLSSTGAVSVNVFVDGTVLPAQLNIAADNARKFYGDPLPVFTLTYTGFVNGENQSQLTVQPIVKTSVTTLSPVGKYPITVSGAAALNYVITYTAGTLEIVTGDISIINTFTPNGDGINDTWDIKNLNLYSQCTVEVLNRYGEKVFYANGYPKPWDGTFNGRQLPVGTYYYIIKLKPGAKALTGPVNIVR